MRRGVLVLVVAAVAAGCGGDGDQPTAASSDRAGLPPSPLHRPGEVGASGTERRRACALVGVAALARVVGASAPAVKARPTESLDLSACDWHGGRVGDVRLIVDSAPSAQLRFFNQLSEQLEYHNRDVATGQRPVQIRAVGEDSAYGGAGAWWTPARKQLVAYAHQRIVRVRVVVDGLGDAARRRAAVRVARIAFARLRAE